MPQRTDEQRVQPLGGSQSDSGLGFVISAAQAELFWSRVDTSDTSPDGCWPYKAEAPGRRGRYGHVRIYLAGHDVFAHRAAHVLQGGVLSRAENAVLMHSCDRGSCQRGSHIQCGTIALNNASRDQRNRRTPYLPRGAASWAARLTDREAQAIRAGRQLNVPVKALADMFSISPASVYNVLSARYYPAVPPDPSRAKVIPVGTATTAQAGPAGCTDSLATCAP